MSKQNCWEYKKCGRQLDGNKVAEFGICPAALETKTDNINSGKNAGRSCWAVTGTFCGGKVQGTFASKLSNCMNCEFYNLVIHEEDKEYVSAKAILGILKGN